MDNEFISKLQYLLGQHGYNFLCSTNQRYTNPDLQKALEISLLLDYLLGEEDIPQELIQGTSFKDYLNDNDFSLNAQLAQQAQVAAELAETNAEASATLATAQAVLSSTARNEAIAAQLSAESAEDAALASAIAAEISNQEVQTLLGSVNILGTILTGFTTGSNTSITSLHNILTAFQDAQAQINAKQNLITAGTTLQYYRGDKTFQTLNTLAVPELTNLYFTEVRVRSTPLTGYTLGANISLASGDSMLEAFQKVQGQINARISGTIASGQVAFGTGVNTIGGDSGLLWDNALKRLNFFLSSTKNVDIRNTGIIFWGNNVDSGTSRGRLTWDTGLTILESYGNLDIRTTGSSRVFVDATGLVGILTTTPTNTLDVNGTTRIRTLSNATGNFVTTSATGVLQQRTAAEVKSDLGLTTAVTGTGVAGQVAFWSATGTSIITGNNNLFWDTTNNRLGILTTTPLGRFHIQDGRSNAFVIGADNDANSLTTNTTKAARISTPNYDNAQPPFGIISGISAVSGNIIEIGSNKGGLSKSNVINFHTDTIIGSGPSPLRWSILNSGVLQSSGAQTIQTSTGTLTISTLAGNGNILLVPHGTGVVRVGVVGTGFHKFGVASINLTAPTLGTVNGGASLGLFNTDTNYGTIFYTKTTGQGVIQQMRVDGVATAYSLNLQELGGNILIGTATDSGERLNVNGTVRIQSIANAIGNFATYSATGVLQQRTALQSADDILNSISGYNAGVNQRLEHNSSGVKVWVNI